MRLQEVDPLWQQWRARVAERGEDQLPKVDGHFQGKDLLAGLKAKSVRQKEKNNLAFKE